MRVGQNPAKAIEHVAQPSRITAAVITYIPFLGGYYSHSLEILKVCLSSLRQNADLPFDLLVFDNASCTEVRDYLCQAHRRGEIQFLWLSDRNIGKGGAWNVIFGGAPGEIIAYADSDIYFFPGWLSVLVKVLEVFPQAGMVTGMPMWSPPEYSRSTIEWGQSHPEARLERGRLLPWEDYWRHARSLGQTEAEARAYHEAHEDICLHFQGQRYYVGAGHFQFVARKRALQSVLPIPSERPMGQVRSLDRALDEQGYLRLSTPDWWVQHLGNTLEGLGTLPGAATQQNPPSRQPKLIRRALLWLHNQTFRLLYRS